MTETIARQLWYDKQLYRQVEWSYPFGYGHDEFLVATASVDYEDWTFMINDASDYVFYIAPDGTTGQFLGG